ncbi:hypothetical protein A2662_04020 [Candidatus Giovannonibacteria bacterium RIFCSPHIGHO2_01_FULL_45_33]|uniref:Uncharacterized protein n=1 Tax=Candidatus Giovannonibacteria bacterium RIFCSPLOWO2_01_FULL_45_34 TaxID=1798351 RepID=A0A1F5X048_9BACT|nr:MAG: hypothetical protein A2662_04020 [Candidatus Giovannonibacteria bacterium RIFCSPHIGHO2_01_FULL_45_33]OGF81267.1 MAG: hypothetical protein A2930_02285 [Candidatus Giovannonibacteria bacterium RIFCSPLOWO2_01_FULL_45_34]
MAKNMKSKVSLCTERVWDNGDMRSCDKPSCVAIDAIRLCPEHAQATILNLMDFAKAVRKAQEALNLS